MFTLNENENEKLNEWLKTLTPSMDAYAGAIGGRLTYSFTPTSLGSVIKVSDCMSGEEIDLTDYNCW